MFIQSRRTFVATTAAVAHQKQQLNPLTARTKNYVAKNVILDETRQKVVARRQGPGASQSGEAKLRLHTDP
jgi:hypothetical protein